MIRELRQIGWLPDIAGISQKETLVCINRGALEIWRIIVSDGWRWVPQHEDPKRQQECDLEQEFMSWPCSST
jgi:hypothetical protein